MMIKKYFKIKKIRKANNYSSENRDYIYKVADIYQEEKEFEILIKCTHVEHVLLGKRGEGRWEIGRYLELEYKEKWEREIFGSQIKIYWAGSSSYYHHLCENNVWVSPDLGISEYDGSECIVLRFIDSPEEEWKKYRSLPADYLTKKYKELWQKNTESQRKINELEKQRNDLINELAAEKEESKERINDLKIELQKQLSWKTKIKHMALSSLVIFGGRETYNWYQTKNNLTQLSVNYNFLNDSWLDNVYQNIPFNKPEYKNLTNLLKLPQEEKAQKSLDKINDLLFSDFSASSLDLEAEIARLKINDLTVQIPSKKNELEKLITEIKSKPNKAENYLLEQLLAENPNSEKLIKLKEILSDHQTEIELILTRKRKLRELERYLEGLQSSQLEARIELHE